MLRCIFFSDFWHPWYKVHARLQYKMYGLVQLELVGCMLGESTVLLGVPREQLTRCAHKKCETELASVQRQGPAAPKRVWI